MESLERLQALVQTSPFPQEVMAASASLALSAQRSAEALRQSGLSELMAKGPRDAPPSGSASASTGSPHPKTPTATKAPPPLPAEDLHRHDSVREHDNPHLSSVLSYSQIATLALRQLAAYVQYGPKPVRKMAIGELVRISSEQPRFARLESLAHESRLLEADPELRRELDALLERLQSSREGR